MAILSFDAPASLRTIPTPRSTCSGRHWSIPRPSAALLFNPDGTFEYTPPADFIGDVTFTYTAQDFHDSSVPAVVTLHVRPPDEIPTAVADSYTLVEDTDLFIDGPASVLANDGRGDLVAEHITGPFHGELTLSADGALRYAPRTNFSGEDYFLYRWSDGTIKSATARHVTFSVTAAPDPPNHARRLSTFARHASWHRF